MSEQNINVEILFDDGDIIAAVKPSGIETRRMPNGGGMADILAGAVGGGVIPVERLDREIAGVAIFARTERSREFLADAFAAGRASMTFAAVVSSPPAQKSGVLRDLVYHDARRNKSYVVKCMRRGVRDAELSYRVVGAAGGRALLALEPSVCRPHLMRAQLASHSMPVLGDRRYGGAQAECIALASAEARIPNPAGGGPICVKWTPSGGIWQDFCDFTRLVVM